MSEQVSPEQFAVGEIAIMQNCYYECNNGQECIVIGGLEPRFCFRDEDVKPRYRIQLANGKTFVASPHKLRKKRPPRKDLEVVRWADCPWQPESLHV